MPALSVAGASDQDCFRTVPSLTTLASAAGELL